MFAPQQAHLTAATPNDAKEGAAATALVVDKDAAMGPPKGFSEVNAHRSYVVLDLAACATWVCLRFVNNLPAGE